MIKFDRAFIRRFKRTTKAKSPILFFHSHNQDGEMEYQGFIYYLDEDGAGAAQLFECLFGQRGDEITFAKEFLTHCTFYDNDRDWHKAVEGGKFDECERVRKVITKSMKS